MVDGGCGEIAGGIFPIAGTKVFRHMRLAAELLRAVPPVDESAPLPPIDGPPPPATWIETLYRSHGARLLRYFSRRAGKNEASDLLQESFARLADATKASADIVCPEAYINTIATNLLRDRAKAALRRSLAVDVTAEEVPLSGPDPTRTLEDRDKLRRLDVALHAMKPKTRDIFLAHRLEGLSYKQLAVRFGLGVKGVEWHMTKAIAHLERAFRHG